MKLIPVVVVIAENRIGSLRQCDAGPAEGVDGLLAFDAPSKRGLRFLWQEAQLKRYRLEAAARHRLFVHPRQW